ncbi:MAG: hypothetical protein A2151_06820, partial [Candidatus Muproteobacteria bacterium RBG_16_65_34]
VYPLVARAVGARTVEVKARDWGHDLGALRAAVSPRTRLIFIANPNNPTGTWLHAPELKAFIADLPAHVIVVVDEAYFEYVRADGYESALPWIGRHPNLIVTRTFSKIYGLAGLRVGYGVSSPEVADVLNRVRQPFNVNSVALAAAGAALADGEHVERTARLNREGMRRLTLAFGAMGLEFIPSVGNFVCVDLGRPAAPVYERLLREGVIVRPVANYGMPNHLRVTVGLPEENERFLGALEKVLRTEDVALSPQSLALSPVFMINRLCIIGVGLIGGSLARALREARAVREIVGYGRSLGNLQQAVDLGVVDRAAVSAPDAVRGADMIVLAVPVGAMPEILGEIAAAIDDGAVITDVGSVKGGVIEVARRALGARFARFVPGHPIAGTEQSGVAASLADLFAGRRVILTPEAETDPGALASVRAMWSVAGAEVVAMSAGEHDRILAVGSHLPHLLAFALMDLVVRRDDHRAVFQCVGNGFRDLTRIAASDPVMWRDICFANREAVLEVLRQYRDNLAELELAIARGDGEWLIETFTRAKHARDALNKKS